MNILYFHQYFSTPDGATGTRSYEFARALVEKGHKVTIICLRNDRSVTGLENKIFKKGTRRGLIDSINVIEINLDYSNNYNLIKRSLIFLKFTLKSILVGIKENSDLVICTSTPLTISIPGIALKFFKNIPLVFEVRDLWPELPVAMKLIKNKFIILLLEILERVSYYYSDAVIGLSPGICEGIKKRSNKKIIYEIPNACDLDLFNYSNTKKLFPSINSHSKINKKNNILVAAFAGAHGKANGLESILYAAKELLDLGRRDIHFVFVGEGSEKKSLIDIAEKEKIVNCHFLDPLSKKELSNFLKDYVDVGLMVLKDIPEFYNGTSPNKFFDYISSGLPILINYPGWLSDLVLKYDVGVSVPPNNSHLFAKSLITLLKSPENLKLMGKNARELAENKFSRRKLAKRFIYIIEKTHKQYCR